MYAYIIYTYTYDLKSCDEDSAHALVTVGLQSLRLGAVCGLWPQPKIRNWNPKTLEPRITEFAFDLQSGGNFAGTIIFGDYFLWNVKFTVLGVHNMFLEFALLINHQGGRIVHLHQRFPSFVENKDHLAEVWYNVGRAVYQLAYNPLNCTHIYHEP